MESSTNTPAAPEPPAPPAKFESLVRCPNCGYHAEDFRCPRCGYNLAAWQEAEATRTAAAAQKSDQENDSKTE